MENKCENCEHFNQCELKMIIHNPTKIKYENLEDTGGVVECDNNFIINKGDRIAQATLIEHKGYLFGIESTVVRDGGLGSTDE